MTVVRYIFGDYVLDMELQELSRDGHLIPLRRKAFQLLVYLLANPQRVVSKDELFDQLWPQQFLGDASLNTCLREVRLAVGDNGREQQIIRTVRGSGYRVIVPVVVKPEETASSDMPISSADACLCHLCQHSNPATAQFCNACGAHLASICAHCGQKNDRQARFCPACATPLIRPLHPTSGAAPIPLPHDVQVANVERRQLTVLFCDLVGYTSLSERLDPEDLRDVMEAYYTICQEAVQRFDGTISQYLGDGVMVYFGYPQAHEDDAQRAVRAGLSLLGTLGSLNVQLEPAYRVHLTIRVGIHTGLVVVGNIGRGEQPEQLALGSTPNVAARLQALASPNTVVISAATYRLIQGYFVVDDLGRHTLSGLSTPLEVFRVERESTAQSRLETASTRGLTPFVGREAELTLLRDRWVSVKAGQGQVATISGEAGIGKSRLVQMVKEEIAWETHARLECRSSPYYRNTALYPLIDGLQDYMRLSEASPQPLLERLEQVLGSCRVDLDEAMLL